MPQIPFVGDTYNSRSPNINASRAVNWYPEVSRQDSKSVVALIGTPGTQLFVNSGASAIRGMHVFNNLLYFVSGQFLYSVNAAGVISNVIATLSTSTGNVAMKDNGLSPTGGNQLIIVDGLKGYIYNVSTGIFSIISSPGFPATGATAVTYLDGYFIVNNASPSISFYVSNLFDGTTWNALATGSASATSDPLQQVWNVHQQLALIKQYSTEFFYDAGVATSSGSPFLRVPGAVIDYGTPAPQSVAQGDNTIFFLAQQRMNDGAEFVGVCELDGYTPRIISPVSINYQISQMPTIMDAFAYCYAAEGHYFYVITFPTGNATYVYDTSTQMWHERSLYSDNPYKINRHIGQAYAFFSNKHLIGDYRNGNIYWMDSQFLTDNGSPIVSVRTSQHLNDPDEYERFFIHQLWVDMETGDGVIAISTPVIANGSIQANGTVVAGAQTVTSSIITTNLEPQGQLSWSDDGGHVFSNDYQASVGSLGQFKKRLLWRRLGSTRDRVWRLAMSDNSKKVILSARVQVTKGTS